MEKQGGKSLEKYLAARKALVEEAMDRFLSLNEDCPEMIRQSVRYSMFAGGKRIRPILCLAAAEAVGGAWQGALPCACALEMIHTYSLIHDDLPAMDNDAFRRGKPTNHIVFGEGPAILAGDALLTEAFSLLSNPVLDDAVAVEKRMHVLHLIARAAGMTGMVGGQVMDVQSEGKILDQETLADMHRRKTGAMLTVSVVSGAIIGGASDREVEVLTRYGQKVGLAFQIADDILNVTGDSAVLGKSTGSDVCRGKTTFPALLGLDASRTMLAALVADAVSQAQVLGEGAEPLRLIAKYIMERNI